MSLFVVKRGEVKLPLMVPVQFDLSEPSPTPSAATMVLRNTVTRAVITRTMAVDNGPPGLIYLVYFFTQGDWDGQDFPLGKYRAHWEMTQDSKRTVAPSRGYDVLRIEDVRGTF